MLIEPKRDIIGNQSSPTILPNLKVGDIINGDYFEIEDDGTDVRKGDATTWDEVSRTFVGQSLYSPAGRIDYNFIELTVDYASNALYPSDFTGLVVQAMHARKPGSDIRPHIHWIQNQGAMPNLLVGYRFYDNGAPVPGSWTLKALTASDNAFTYPGSGSIQQVTEFNLAPGTFSGMGLSFTFDCKVYRDTTNVSTLFTGADAYSGVWAAKYYDIHFEKDMTGSREEFVK
jgi:hypothetical protein